ncbi:MAG TPA: Uma2 family endonuclease [Thermoanaerobaculia bacterium]|nr:Uma2 family endonuclease [Thermoanaerobaculia bacterium]
MAEPLKRLFTRDEYYAMAEAGILKPEDRVELIEGEIYRMSPIGDRHAFCVTLLSDAFSVLSAQGRVSLSSQNPVHLSDFSEPQPDLAILHRRRAGGDSGHPTPSMVYLLIEVADTSLENDQRSKMPLYARCGIPEAWLVDLTRNVLEVYRDPSREGYRSIQRLRRGDRIAPLAFPDFEIAVETILP